MATKKITPAKKVIKKTPPKKSTKSTGISSAKGMSGVEIAKLFDIMENPADWNTEKGGMVVDHFLPLKTASKWVGNFNKSKTAVPKSSFMQPENIDKEIFLELLNNPKVKKLRIYFGINDKKKIRLIFVGADATHNDVYLKRSTGRKAAMKIMQATEGAEDGAIDMGQGCPSYDDKIAMLPA